METLPEKPDFQNDGNAATAKKNVKDEEVPQRRMKSIDQDLG
jgi:hypothetical protein